MIVILAPAVMGAALLACLAYVIGLTVNWHVFAARVPRRNAG